MPELPEVETTLRGIKPHIIDQKIIDVIVRHPRLRWPVPVNLKKRLQGQKLSRLYRRGKYLLFEFDTGTLILHLGMSGRVRILPEFVPARKHDHIDISFDNGKILRFTDPRRFGALLWTAEDPLQHPLLKEIGPEPLSDALSGDYLWERARNRKVAVKSFIMDSRIIAGVGNIYATEALFLSKIRPQTAAGKLGLEQYRNLAASIKTILEKAIQKGGTTLKDFTKSDGTPGYFSIELQAYGHAGKPCPRCRSSMKSARIGQRSTVYCPSCQK